MHTIAELIYPLTYASGTVYTCPSGAYAEFFLNYSSTILTVAGIATGYIPTTVVANDANPKFILTPGQSITCSGGGILSGTVIQYTNT
jgi:hypothetical protein